MLCHGGVSGDKVGGARAGESARGRPARKGLRGAWGSLPLPGPRETAGPAPAARGAAATVSGGGGPVVRGGRRRVSSPRREAFRQLRGNVSCSSLRALPALGVRWSKYCRFVTTGLVGLAVAENPHERLRILYTKILGVLQNIPKDAAYRKYTEQIVNQRFNLVQKETDVQKLQDKLNSGHIEEVIVQAENELSLARKMIQWKPWEPLVEEPPSDQWRWPI
ncbi:NADH dehydrogenase [ubiquinone] 1 alpha subcomplex subunit 5 isoform X1 [Calonectris borealis]|uniref:NADH dehydrogenase [ubiquinone] 1 alpha subcomplex subunit 5 isoform X1 n=1 Tax=Calonectris borealis TaxID=1323832 RepID=UPI003F4BF1B5